MRTFEEINADMMPLIEEMKALVKEEPDLYSGVIILKKGEKGSENVLQTGALLGRNSLLVDHMTFSSEYSKLQVAHILESVIGGVMNELSGDDTDQSQKSNRHHEC